jgi:MFS family permease
VVVSISPNLLVASIGLFLSGTGANTSLNATIFFFNEILTNVKRQKYSVFVQLAFAFGSIIISSFYYLAGHWRIGSIILITIPSLIALFLVFFYIEDTPQFLVKGPINEALKSLNRIGKINYKIKNIIEEEDILAVK